MQGEDTEKEKQRKEKKILLLDGFPRDISQIKLTGMSDDDDDEKEEDLEFLQPDLVLFLDCPGEIAQRRYLSRGLPGRDVDVRIFERRFEEFERLNGEVVEEFEKRGILIRVSQGGEGGDGFGEGCVEKGVLDFFLFSADTLSCTDRYESRYGDVLSTAVAGVARLGLCYLRRSGKVGEGRRKRDVVGSSVDVRSQKVRMGRLASTEQINDDVPSFHEIDRLASDVEYAERMERFRAELVTSSGTCLCAKSTFIRLFPG